jgi:hypothetical protein
VKHEIIKDQNRAVLRKYGTFTFFKTAASDHVNLKCSTMDFHIIDINRTKL